MAYSQSVAAKSPKPTVSMMLMPQQYPQTYCYHQGARLRPRLKIHPFSSPMFPMLSKRIESMCANAKLKTNTFPSDQNCYLQLVEMSFASTAYKLRSNKGILVIIVSPKYLPPSPLKVAPKSEVIVMISSTSSEFLTMPQSFIRPLTLLP